MEVEQPNNEKTLTPIQEKRQKLKVLSGELKESLLDGDKLNDLIVEHYKEGNPEIEGFNTYNGWRKEGFQVKKGEQAYLVWGRPKEQQEGEKAKEAAADEDGEKFYPVAFIFSNLQVRPIDQKEAA
jgi:hypothetical protein